MLLTLFLTLVRALFLSRVTQSLSVHGPLNLDHEKKVFHWKNLQMIFSLTDKKSVVLKVHSTITIKSYYLWLVVRSHRSAVCPKRLPDIGICLYMLNNNNNNNNNNGKTKCSASLLRAFANMWHTYQARNDRHGIAPRFMRTIQYATIRDAIEHIIEIYSVFFFMIALFIAPSLSFFGRNVANEKRQ